MEELLALKRGLLLEMISLGMFSVLSIGYAIFVWMLDLTQDSDRAGRFRVTVLVSVTVLGGAMLVLGVRNLAQMSNQFEGVFLAFPRGPGLAARLEQLITPLGLWIMMGIATVLSMTPLFAREREARARLTRAVAGLTFLLGLGLLLLGVWVYSGYQGVTAIQMRIGSVQTRPFVGGQSPLRPTPIPTSP